MKTRHIILFIFCTITLWGKAQCINMTDLHDPSITCTYGYVVNCDKEIIEGTPYDNIGVIDASIYDVKKKYNDKGRF